LKPQGSNPIQIQYDWRFQSHSHHGLGLMWFAGNPRIPSIRLSHLVGKVDEGKSWFGKCKHATFQGKTFPRWLTVGIGHFKTLGKCSLKNSQIISFLSAPSGWKITQLSFDDFPAIKHI
jgi:hypothetical protein